jgi:hypothetical protein
MDLTNFYEKWWNMSKWIVQPDPSSSEHGTLAASGENGSEPSGYTSRRGFLEQVSYYQLPK